MVRMERKGVKMALVDGRVLARLKGIVEAGMASVEEEVLYRRTLQELEAERRNGIVSTETLSPAAVETAYELRVSPETFERGWSAGGSTPPDRNLIGPGVLDAIEMSRTGEDTVFFWFHSRDAEQGAPGYWRGSYSADKILERDGRAGKVKDVLRALGMAYTLKGDLLQFHKPLGRSADCDWQMVDIKGKPERRIQGVYPVGQRQLSV